MHNRTDIFQSLTGTVGAIQLVRSDQFELLGCQGLAELHGAERVGARDDLVMKPTGKIAGQVLHFFGYCRRHFLALHRFPSGIGDLAGFEPGALSLQLPQ
ncbi:hypothetical protein AWN90_40000 [Nocardia terpenica]|uniref:Uncharacterized protein n=1 Tax=Nocardia terpenica TaxID=455432 RepID=A0A164JUX7_9NOCA|nr:hypothetical protein AWN90_40000 [Nocardia terpenica]